MEEGSLRVDANVSVRPAGEQELGTKAELKNMNSFRFLERGINAEIARQIELIEGGGKVDQETLHFDPRTGALTPLRSKEYAHDYRYFPEPDLVPLAPTEEMVREATESLPELPGGPPQSATATSSASPTPPRSSSPTTLTSASTSRRCIAAAGNAEPTVAANWITNELTALLRDGDAGERPDPGAMATLIAMVDAGKISHKVGKQILATVVSEGGDPEALAKDYESEGDLGEIVDRAIEAEPEAAEKVRAGEMRAIGPLVGAVMKETRGAADGGEVTKLIREKLGL